MYEEQIQQLKRVKNMRLVTDETRAAIDFGVKCIEEHVDTDGIPVQRVLTSLFNRCASLTGGALCPFCELRSICSRTRSLDK